MHNDAATLIKETGAAKLRNGGRRRKRTTQKLSKFMPLILISRNYILKIMGDYRSKIYSTIDIIRKILAEHRQNIECR